MWKQGYRINSSWSCSISACKHGSTLETFKEWKSKDDIDAILFSSITSNKIAPRIIMVHCMVHIRNCVHKRKRGFFIFTINIMQGPVWLLHCWPSYGFKNCLILIFIYSQYRYGWYDGDDMDIVVTIKIKRLIFADISDFDIKTLQSIWYHCWDFKPWGNRVGAM